MFQARWSSEEGICELEASRSFVQGCQQGSPFGCRGVAVGRRSGGETFVTGAEGLKKAEHRLRKGESLIGGANAQHSLDGSIFFRPQGQHNTPKPQHWYVPNSRTVHVYCWLQCKVTNTGDDSRDTCSLRRCYAYFTVSTLRPWSYSMKYIRVTRYSSVSTSQPCHDIIYEVVSKLSRQSATPADSLQVEQYRTRHLEKLIFRILARPNFLCKAGRVRHYCTFKIKELFRRFRAKLEPTFLNSQFLSSIKLVLSRILHIPVV